MRHQDSNLIVRVNPQPGSQKGLAFAGMMLVGERMAIGSGGGISQQQSTTGDGGSENKTASGQFHTVSSCTTGAGCWAMSSRIALLTLGYVPHRQTLLRLALMVASSGSGLFCNRALTAIIMPDWQ